MSYRALCTVLSAWMLTACASWQPTSPPAPPPANLRQVCGQLPLPTDGTGEGLLLWGRAVIRQYNDCARRHEGLVKAWPT